MVGLFMDSTFLGDVGVKTSIVFEVCFLQWACRPKWISVGILELIHELDKTTGSSIFLAGNCDGNRFDQRRRLSY